LKTKRFDWKFDTFNDSKLVKLLDSVEAWCMIPNRDKSCFTLSGPTERGKTHLLKRVRFLFEEYDTSFPKRRHNYPMVEYVSWGNFTKETMNERNYFDRVEHSGLVLIDDFLSEFYSIFEKKGGDVSKLNTWESIVMQKAFDILNVRVGKPTFITTNLSSDNIQRLDDRVHSRLYREGGQFLEIPKSVKPFLIR